MRYVCSEEYRTFRGYVFWAGKPVTIEDAGTLAAIKNEPAFKEFKDEEKIQEAAEAALLRRDQVVASMKEQHTCPKCGQEFPRNLTMHKRFCKG